MNRSDYQHTAWCETHGKLAHSSRKAAKRICRLYGGSGMREYPCDQIDGYFHVGHLPQATMHGLKTAREVYGHGAS